MCGIAGIFAYSAASPPVVSEEVLRIRDAMIPRGPDGAGVWTAADGRLALAHRRLSIIDLSETGAQPMATADGSLRVVFNGEIYNYRELRRELAGQGHRFQSSSDTEVLLYLYRQYGPDLVHRLRGMYAFALWDAANRRCLLARDPFGIKPLYYADAGGTLRFASQVKALLAGGGVDTGAEPAGHVGFFLWGYVPEPYTLYRGIRSLPPGCILVVEVDGSAKITKFCSIAEELKRAEVAGEQLNYAKDEVRARLRQAVTDSVSHHLIADVPVGAFLSSGLDSSTITALACQKGGRLNAITLGFGELKGGPQDETRLAGQVARRYGADQQCHWITRQDFQRDLPRILEAMDQPSTDGVNTYFVAQAAAAAGLKAALSGLGGDELFGGYPSFRDVPRLAGALSWTAKFPGLGGALRVISAPVLKYLSSPKYAGLLEYGGTYSGGYLLRRGLFMPWELPEVLDPDLAREGWRQLQVLARLDETVRGINGANLKVSALEMTWYMRTQLLRDADWAGMAHSLEIRVPLVDLELLRQVAPLLVLKAPPTKIDLGLTPERPLPEEVLNRDKSGFYVPVPQWLAEVRGKQASPLNRGLRGWAQLVYRHHTGASGASLGPTGVPAPYRSPRRIFALATDAFGGHGGIAKYNRDLLGALCAYPGVTEVVAVPRQAPLPVEPLPPKLSYIMAGLNSKFKYFLTVGRYLVSHGNYDIICCTHLHLLPLAYLARWKTGAPLVLFIYGIDAWKPPGRALATRLAGRVDAVVSISEVTANRFLGWAGVPREKVFILPNAVDQRHYGVGGKHPELLQRYGLTGKTVLLTLGRLAGAERYKGFDEVLELLPVLAERYPDIAYLIVGDGEDRERLQEKARRLGVGERVVFAGFIPEAEKAEHYRLADAYVMPSQGEGFGFVFLEAMACGIGVLGSKIDGSREALQDGALGVLVDPRNREELRLGILEVLQRPRGIIPPGLQHFSLENFTRRCHGLVRQILTKE